MNPLHICYANDAHLRAEQFAGTTSAFVLGRSNCVADEWLRCRDRGSEIYRYLLLPGRPNVRVSAVDEEIYMNNSASVPLWPYKDLAGKQRSHYTNSLMTDIRPGSPFVTYFLDYFAKQLRLRRYSGYFLDTFGSRLWTSAKWDEWPLAERQEWTAGMVDFAKQLDVVRRAEDPSAIIVCNNNFETAPIAEQYIDGVCSENHGITNVLMQKTLGKPYGNLGHRRSFKITRTTEEAAAWAAVPGVTHVCCSAANVEAGDAAYSYPSKPVVGYSAIGVPALEALLTATRAELAILSQERDTAIGQRDVALDQLTTAKDELESALSQIYTVVRERDAADARLLQIHELSA